MANLNRVILAGNLTRDPDARRTNSGISLCKLGMAVNRRFRTQSGEQREEILFVDVDVWGKSADFCRDYLRKGASVLIEGRLRMDSWEDKTTGQQRSKLLVVADHVQSLGSRDGNSQQGQQGSYDQGESSQPQSQQQPPQAQQGGWNSPQAAPQSPTPPPFPNTPQGQSSAQPPAQPPQGQAAAQPQGQPSAPPQAQPPQGQAGAPPADGAFDVSDESIDDIPF